LSKVYFISLKVKEKGFLEKMNMLLRKSGLLHIIDKDDLVGIKIHFGEKGNTSYIRPTFVKNVARFVSDKRGNPFLFDTTTLYNGARSNAVDHIKTAYENGFNFGYPIVIADGLCGEAKRSIEINKKRIKNASLALLIFSCDSIISVAHFKCHMLSAFGGAIKNVAMGCASKEGKLSMHSTVSPFVNKDECVGCGDCTSFCPSDAIEVNSTAEIDVNKCVGCGSCISICKEGAIKIHWNVKLEAFQEKLAEYCYAVCKAKSGKMFYINFLLNVTPSCDCFPSSDTPIVPDIGVLASKDPVAIDQASCDLVNNSIGIESSKLERAFGKGDDKFRDLFSEISWEYGLQYAESIGLGTRKYILKEIV